MDILSKAEVVAAIISGSSSIISIVIGVLIWRHKTKFKSKIDAEFNRQKMHLQNFFDAKLYTKGVLRLLKNFTVY